MINALNTKANTIDVTSSLASKANSVDVYTKTQVDTSLSSNQILLMLIQP